MNEILENKVQALKEEIHNSEEYKKLVELNKLIESNEEVMKLAYLKDMASVKYEDSLKHFKEDSIEVKEAQKELHKAKLNLDNHPLVKQYNEQFLIVRGIYDNINKELFYPFL